MGLRLKKSNVESAEKNNHMTDTQEFPSDRQIQHLAVSKDVPLPQ